MEPRENPSLYWLPIEESMELKYLFLPADKNYREEKEQDRKYEIMVCDMARFGLEQGWNDKKKSWK